MFSPVPMMQVALVVLAGEERKVLRVLGQMGVLHLTRTVAGPGTAPLAAPDARVALARCVQIVTRVREVRQLLGIPAQSRAPSEHAMEGELDQDLALDVEQADAKLRVLGDRAAALVEARRDLGRQYAERVARYEQIAAFRGLDLPVDRLGQSAFLNVVAGSLPEREWPGLLAGLGPDMVAVPLPRRLGRQPVIVMAAREAWPVLDTLLRKAGFRSELPAEGAGSGTVDDLVVDTHCDAARVAAERDRVEADIARFAVDAASTLDAIESMAIKEQRMLEAGQMFARTQTAVLVRGWAPGPGITQLEQRLKTVTGGRCVVRVSAPSHAPEERVPVLLRHGRWLRPFERVMAAYGLPNYRDVEPTLFVALSYLVMFGMMFGDAGHGAVLALAALVGLAAARTAGMRDMSRLVLLAGVSSMAFGIIYGSYFGIPRFKSYGLWRDPLEGELLEFMAGAIAAGVTLLSVGLVLNVVNRLRYGDGPGACLGTFGVAGLWFYWGALILAVFHGTLAAHGALLPGVLLLVLAPVGAWAIQGPLAYARARRKGCGTLPGGVMLAAAESCLHGFEAAVSYLANTVSFVRLAAYAMSHAALLVATFAMAGEVQRATSGGHTAALAVIVAGNAVAIVLEGVVAAVQALRLEYYEFFSKFLHGEGLPFTPFRLEGGGPVVAG